MIIFYNTKVDTQNFVVNTPEHTCEQCGSSRNLIIQKDVLTVKLFWLIPIFRWTSYSMRCSVCGQHKKLSKAVGKELVALAQQPMPPTPTAFEEFSDQKATSFSKATRKITVTRKKSFVGCLVSVICSIDDNWVCSLKNGETQSFSAPTNECMVSMVFQNNQAYSVATIPAGDKDLHYEMSFKNNGFTYSIVLTPIQYQ